MNWYIKLFFLSCFINSQLLAKEVCFQFVLDSFGRGETANTVQGSEFLTVNNKGISFRTTHIEDRNGYIQATTNRGCMSNEYLFDRQNELKFAIETIDGHITTAQLIVDLYVELPGKKVKKLFRHFWPEGTFGTNFSITEHFTLKELDPEKAAEIDRNKKRENEIKSVRITIKK